MRITIPHGSLVEVAAGPLKGKRGYIQCDTQGGTSREAFEVRFELASPKEVWILASLLKVVGAANG